MWPGCPAARFFWALLAGASIANLCSLPAAELQLRIVDETTNDPVPARVRVRCESGEDHAPPHATQVPTGPQDTWFVSAGQSQLVVPPGRAQLRVERGLEYRPVKQTVTIPQDGTLSHVVVMRRWIDMRRRGYVCGENHLHVPATELGPMLAAEDLDFGTSLQWWNARRYDVPPGEGCVRLLEFGSVRVPTSVFDYELEHGWGAVYVIGQPTPLEQDDDPSQPNLPTLLRSRAAGALVCYQGGWSREVVLDALLGCVDVVNVCNNNFLRHAYQPRSIYSNLLDVAGFPTYPNDPLGMMHMNTETYYRLLNCGLRLAAGAGSATGPKRTPVGYNRAYVRADGRPSLQQFLEAWRAGKNFVTNGPMLLLQIDGQHRPGDSIALGPDGGTLNVHVHAVCDQPVTAVEVVLNGQVVGALENVSQGTAELKLPVTIRDGSWIAARCTAEDRLLSDEELGRYRWGSERLPRRPTRLRFAHTSPIYVTVGGRSARVARSVSEALQMLEAFAAYANDQAHESALKALRDRIDDARRILKESPENASGN